MCARPWTLMDLMPCWWCWPDWPQPFLVFLDPRLCLKVPCILHYQRSLLRIQCKSSGYHLAPSVWYPGYILCSSSQSWCVLERCSSWINQSPCLEYCYWWGQQSRRVPPVWLHFIWCCGWPMCRTRSMWGLGQLGSQRAVEEPQLPVNFLTWYNKMVICTGVIIINILVSVTFMPSNRQADTLVGWSVFAYLITHVIRGNFQTNHSIHIDGCMSEANI